MPQPIPPVIEHLSGITPSGPLTLGNYLGALRRFRAHQDRACFFVADLHALTTEHDPRRLRELTISTAALFFASGLDPDRAIVFQQSDVPAHVELAYLLECTAHVGELGRMIQFKEKGDRPGSRASLFTYPCLMAADILLYGAAKVPVGGDQSQHVELARDLARRFNSRYGETFVVPDLVPDALTTRVRDLADPRRKMSKSAPPAAPGVVRVLDDTDTIRRKIRRAVTDADGELRYDPDAKPGVANLAEIAGALTGRSPAAVLQDVANYGELKDACASAIDDELRPVRRRHDELQRDPAELERLLDLGARRAREIAEPRLERARAAFGVAVRSGDRPHRLGLDDAAELLTVQRAAFVTEAQLHDDTAVPPLTESLDEVEVELADPEVIALGVREGSRRLVATVRVRFDGDSAVIGRLAVVPDRQGHGLGTRLMRAVEAHLPPTIGRLRIFTGERSLRNVALYTRLGYAEVGRVPTGRGYHLVELQKDTRDQAAACRAVRT